VRKTFRYDPDAKELIPLDEWLRKYGDPSEKAHHIIGEFKPYRPVTGDMEGKWITSRRQHREFLKRNNLVEVGNEKFHMTRYGGMTADNPNLMSNEKREEQICRSLVKNLERLRSR
jgi:hypothetical protein